MRLRLYHYWRSSSSWRVRWAMALKGVSCEFVALNLLADDPESPEHLARNPLGYVPVLEFLDEKRKAFRFLAESMAIIEWLEETYPKPSLLAGDSVQKAKVRQLAEIINAGTQPLQNLNVSQFHSSNPEEQKNWNRHWIQNGLHSYEALLQETAGQFSMGDTLTLADLFLVPQCYNAKRNDISLSKFPKIEQIFNTAFTLPSCIESAPDRFEPKK